MNVLKQTATLVENRFLKTGRVLETRSWSPVGFVEIDLHLPGCDMSGWAQTQHLKCRVAPFTYRDYSPAGWDAATQTCTLYIDTAHEGPGSRWAGNLQRGDAIAYLGVDSSRHHAEKGRQLVFLGDETAIGHFFSLAQLASPASVIDGALSIQRRDHQRQFAEYFPGLRLQLLDKKDAPDHRSLLQWTDGFIPAGPDTQFYLAGYSPAVVQLRKLLRQKGYGSGQVRAQGFWN